MHNIVWISGCEQNASRYAWIWVSTKSRATYRSVHRFLMPLHHCLRKTKCQTRDAGLCAPRRFIRCSGGLAGEMLQIRGRTGVCRESDRLSNSGRLLWRVSFELKPLWFLPRWFIVVFCDVVRRTEINLAKLILCRVQTI